MYAPKAGLYWCVIDEQTIILDCTTDRYFMMGMDAGVLLDKLVQNAPINDGDFPLMEKLGSLHFLAKCSADAPTSPKPTLPPPLYDLDGINSTKPSMRRVIESIYWQIRIDSELRFLGLNKSIKRIEFLSRKNLPEDAQIDDNNIIQRNYKEIIDFKISHLVIPSQSKCLRTSLAMWHYLLKLNKKVNFVIGVKTRPFSAHAWLQSGQVILNYRLDEVQAFKPILVL